MATPAQILEVLTARKEFDGTTWRVFADDGTELTDPGGVLWRGLHGSLLWNTDLVLFSIVNLLRRRQRR